MPEVVSRRRRLPVPCHPGTWVGDYVPFYFCPRSVMLYVISRKNHPSLTYRGGQRVPWSLIERIGVQRHGAARRVDEILASTSDAHRPRVEVRRDWYYQETEAGG